MKYFQTNIDSRYWMRSNGFYCGINAPEVWKDEDHNVGLPPYAKRRSFLVDEYPACPQNWMRSRGKTTSWFVGVPKDHGLWLDFNKNNQHSYHVAIVISVQGINPITGMPCTDASLEQYIEKCPKCDKDFGPERYCAKCGFHWPKQNYISTTGQPEGYLWLDGFRTAEGMIRQYILTEDKVRGVANNIVGNDRVFAIGISFFLSKEKKPQKPDIQTRGVTGTLYGATNFALDWDAHDALDYMDQLDYSIELNSSTTADHSPNANMIQCSSPKDKNDQQTSSHLLKSSRKKTKSYARHVQTKQLEVGAGTKIEQKICDDPEPLDFWRDEPEAILCINYCFEDDASQILKQGREPIKDNAEGFLQNVLVGN